MSETDRERERERETDRERDRQRDRERERERDRQSDRQSESERDTQWDRQRARETLRASYMPSSPPGDVGPPTEPSLVTCFGNGPVPRKTNVCSCYQTRNCGHKNQHGGFIVSEKIALWTVPNGVNLGRSPRDLLSGFRAATRVVGSDMGGSLSQSTHIWPHMGGSLSQSTHKMSPWEFGISQSIPNSLRSKSSE